MLTPVHRRRARERAHAHARASPARPRTCPCSRPCIAGAPANVPMLTPVLHWRDREPADPRAGPLPTRPRDCPSSRTSRLARLRAYPSLRWVPAPLTPGPVTPPAGGGVPRADSGDDVLREGVEEAVAVEHVDRARVQVEDVDAVGAEARAGLVDAASDGERRPVLRVARAVARPWSRGGRRRRATRGCARAAPPRGREGSRRAIAGGRSGRAAGNRTRLTSERPRRSVQGGTSTNFGSSSGGSSGIGSSSGSSGSSSGSSSSSSSSSSGSSSGGCGGDICAPNPGTCTNGKSYTFCTSCDGTDVCYYLVGGQRFDCASCNDTSGCFQASLAACQ